jgi:hypothetical protein
MAPQLIRLHTSTAYPKTVDVSTSKPVTPRNCRTGIPIIFRARAWLSRLLDLICLVVRLIVL